MAITCKAAVTDGRGNYKIEKIDFPEIVSLYDEGTLMLEEMVTRTYPLHNLQQAFDDMLTGKNAKGVITFD